MKATNTEGPKERENFEGLWSGIYEGFSLGHPSTGFFFDRDFFTASCHLPSILRVSGFGPLLAGFFFAGLDMIWRRLVSQPLSLCRFYRQNRSLAVIHSAIVPEKVVLPEIAMQVFPADIVINANDTALH